MVDPGRPVPGHAEVPLHVGVVGKQFAVGVETKVIGVPVAATPEFPLLAVGISADDEAARGKLAGGMPVAVPHPADDHVFVPVGRQATGAIGGQFNPPLVWPDACHGLWLGHVLHTEGRVGMVATDNEQPCAVW